MVERRLILYRSNRIEALLDCLAEELGRAPAHPLAPETIVVQSRGMATWLGLRLAERFGIWANPDFPHPRHFIERLLKAALGEEQPLSPFNRDPLTLALLQILSRLPTTGEFAPLNHYLDGADDWKLLQLAERIADLFDQYAVYRPEMVLAWEQGGGFYGEGAHGGSSDGKGVAGRNTTGALWQPILWRQLVRQLGSPLKPLREALERLRLQRLAASELLPERLSLFGITTLPPLYLTLFNELARLIPVHLLLFSPAQDYWADIFAPAAMEKMLLSRNGEEEEALHLSGGHPLLASLGTVGREFQDILEEQAEYQSAPDGERFPVATNAEAPSLLARLQDDILLLQPPQARPLAAADHSIVIHSCHSPLREVEVLQDQLLALLESGEFSSHQIVVMVPEIETYAPLIEAVFNRPRGDRRRIPYRVADRPLSREAALIDTLFRLFELARGRLPLSKVLDFLASGPVRQSLGADRQQLRRIEQWLRQCRVCWGIDAEHRRQHEQPADYLNTWRFGLDRLLLGYAMPTPDFSDPGAGEQLFAGLLPHGDIEGQDSATAGLLLAFCAKLFKLSALIRTPKTLAQWAEVVVRALEDFLGPGPGFGSGSGPGNSADDWQRQEVRDALAALVGEGEQAALTRPLELPAFLRLLRSRLDEAGNTPGFLDGGLTFCTMLPLRTIPFPVVCLLGMNDGAFPRRDQPSGFDLLAAEPRPGDRSRRRDDRFLFLESLLAARHRLYISYVGRSIRDNRLLPPSVLVDELLDCLAEMIEPEVTVQQHRRLRRSAQLTDNGYAALGCLSQSAALLNGYSPLDRRLSVPVNAEEGSDPARHRRDTAAALTVEHPLQPFSPRYFQGDSGPLFSYAAEYLPAAAPAAVQPAAQTTVSVAAPPAPPTAAGQLDSAEPVAACAPLAASAPASARNITLADLQRFFRNPAAWYARRRLGVRLPEREEELVDREPLYLEGLERYRIGRLFLRHLQRASIRQPAPKAEQIPALAPAGSFYQLLRAAGVLPPGGAAEPALAEIIAELQPVATFLATSPAGPPLPPLTLDLPLAADLRLGGELGERARFGLLRATPAKSSGHFFLAAWLEHLALCAQAPTDQDTQTIMVGRGDHNQADIRIFRPLEQAKALAWLQELALLLRTGEEQPLPLFKQSSLEFALKIGANGQAPDESLRAKAQEAARQSFHGSGYSRRGLPPDLGDPYVELLFSDCARPEFEGGLALPPGFAEVACQVYHPLLQNLEQE